MVHRYKRVAPCSSVDENLFGFRRKSAAAPSRTLSGALQAVPHEKVVLKQCVKSESFNTSSSALHPRHLNKNPKALLAVRELLAFEALAFACTQERH